MSTWSNRKPGLSAAMSAAIFYFLSSLFMNFLNKMVVSSYSFNFPFSIMACQMVVTILFLNTSRGDVIILTELYIKTEAYSEIRLGRRQDRDIPPPLFSSPLKILRGWQVPISSPLCPPPEYAHALIIIAQHVFNWSSKNAIPLPELRPPPPLQSFR